MSDYPTSAKTFTTKTGGQTIAASHMNDVQDEVNAIEVGLLQGSARLNSSHSTMVALSVTGGSTILGDLTARGGWYGGGQTITLSSGNSHNLAIASTATFLVINGSANGSTVTGISAPSTNNRVVFAVIGTANVALLDQNGGSSADSQFVLSSAASTLTVSGFYVLAYISNKWRVTRQG